MSEEELGHLFSQHGNLLTKKLLRDQGGKNKGIAFVRWVTSKTLEVDEMSSLISRIIAIIGHIRFSKKSEAETAIANLHGHFFPGLTLVPFPAMETFCSQEQAEGLTSRWLRTMAGRRRPSMLVGWLVRGEGKRTLATMETDLGLEGEAEVVVVIGDEEGEEVQIMVLAENMIKDSRDSRWNFELKTLTLY